MEEKQGLGASPNGDRAATAAQPSPAVSGIAGIPSAAAFRLTADRSIHSTLYARAGDVVFRLKGWDYGCANDDTRGLGIEHTSVTLDPDGDYPFFTIPKCDLVPISPDEAASAMSARSDETQSGSVRQDASATAESRDAQTTPGDAQ